LCLQNSTAARAGSEAAADGQDPPLHTTAEAIQQLHDEGVKIVMLTGDNRRTAEAVARQLGIDEVAADVLPHRRPKS